jgi:hypothetical protein
VEATGGYALGRSLGGTAECGSCDGARGAVATLRFGYELPIRISAFLGAGYLSLGRELDRTVDSTFSGGVPITYVLSDSVRVSGPIGVVGAGYRIPLGRFDVAARLSLGFGAIAARDAITGSARNSSSSGAIDIEASGRTERGALVLAIPEVSFGVRLGAFHVSLGVSALASLTNGPKLPTGEMRVTDASPSCTPGTVQCAPAKSLLAGERAFGRFVMWVPQLSVGVSF